MKKSRLDWDKKVDKGHKITLDRYHTALLILNLLNYFIYVSIND